MLATLRRDGSPRVSGTEVQFHAGDLCMGMMHQGIKSRDLTRDGRFALHTNPGDATMEGGDAKVAGIAFEVTDEQALATYVDEVEPPHRSICSAASSPRWCSRHSIPTATAC